MRDIEKKPEGNDCINVNDDLEIENVTEGSESKFNALDDKKD